MTRRSLKFLSFAIWVLMWSGCNRFGGRTVSVEFRSAEGLRGGEAVYLAGVRVGTSGEPKLVRGRAVVPVTLHRRHKDAVPAGTVFLLKPDPQDARRFCLAGAVCAGEVMGQQSPGSYRGARNQIEFIAICGSARAAEILKELTR